MKQVFIKSLISILAFSTFSFGHAGQVEKSSGLTKEVYDQVIDRVQDIYTPIYHQAGLKLLIQRRWEIDTVNAYSQKIGNRVLVTAFGGIARHKAMTKESLALVLCHEMGHSIGGSPKRSTKNSLPSWISVEGQTDYFSTARCLKRYFGPDDNIEIIKTIDIPPAVSKKCQLAFSDENKVAICIRSAVAGLQLSHLFLDLRGINRNSINFNTPSTITVTETKPGFPSVQCRLDTYLAGSLCDADLDQDVSDTDPKQGYCPQGEIGARPLCWYHPEED